MDGLRERIGQCEIRFRKRVFTREELLYGSTLCARAHETRGGSVEVRIES